MTPLLNRRNGVRSCAVVTRVSSPDISALIPLLPANLEIRISVVNWSGLVDGDLG